MKRLIFPLLMFIIGSQTAYSADAEVFGGIVLGKTTPSQLTQLLTSRGCSWHQEPNGKGVAYTPSEGCYKMFATINQPVFFVVDSTVRLIVQEIPKDMGNKNFDTYVSMLKDKYGAPAEYKRPFVGDATAAWTTESMFVALEFPHMNFDGTLAYGLLSDLKLADQQEKEAKRNTSNETKSML